jgi:hypothetical protein
MTILSRAARAGAAGSGRVRLRVPAVVGGGVERLHYCSFLCCTSTCTGSNSSLSGTTTIIQAQQQQQQQQYNLLQPQFYYSSRKQFATTQSRNSSSSHVGNVGGGDGLLVGTTDAQVLMAAAAEGRRLSELLDQRCNGNGNGNGNATPARRRRLLEVEQQQLGSLSLLQTRIDMALNAANALLQVTEHTDSLTRSILQTQQQTPETKHSITCLHRSFLQVIQWLLILAPQHGAVDMGNDDDEQEETTTRHSYFNPLLERALALAVRAHDVSLFLHLPLYQNLALQVAESSPHNITNNNNNITNNDQDEEDDSCELSTTTTYSSNNNNHGHEHASSSFRADWILRISSWAQTELLLAGSTSISTTTTTTRAVQEEFFSKPLLALALKYQLASVAHILEGMARSGTSGTSGTSDDEHVDEHDPNKLPLRVQESTTKELLFLLKDLISSMWSTSLSSSAKSKTAAKTAAAAVAATTTTLLEKEAIQVVLLLEPSIWRIFDYDPPVPSNDHQDDGFLLDAIDVIITAQEETRDDDNEIMILTLGQLLSPNNLSDDDDDDDEHDTDNDGDEEEDATMEDLQSFFPARASSSIDPKGKALLDFMQAMGHDVSSIVGSNGMSKLPKHFNLEVTKSGDHTILQVTDARWKTRNKNAPAASGTGTTATHRHFPRHFPRASTSEDDGAAEEQDEAALERHGMIYSRPVGYDDFPDVAAQIYKQTSRELIYKPAFEEQILHQLEAPGSHYDDDDDDDYDFDDDDDEEDF